MSASARLLPDGRRLHLSHGPIDIVAEATGAPDEVTAAYRQAAARFAGLLDELVAELPLLRREPGGDYALSGPVARRMQAVCAPHAQTGLFVTPMAAVAGAVAEAVLAAMIAGRRVDRAYANNGGDIALYLGPGADPFRLGVVVDPAAPQSPGALVVSPGDAARGIATSGAPGRSFSLGIADSVTVLAASAPAADVAATLIANAVDLPGHPAIRRSPARDLAPDSDLGDRPVTQGVGPLTPAEVARALDAGEARALAMMDRGLISGAGLVLRGVLRAVGAFPLLPGVTPVRPTVPNLLKGPAHA